jgi:hypothetical protein
VINRELEELRRRIEELENRRNGEVELDCKYKEEVEFEQNDMEGDTTVCLISFLSKKDNVRVEFLCYDGSLKDEALIGWISELERYFEYVRVQYPNCVCFSITKLKGHATLWWDMLHKDIVDHVLEKIKPWKKMVSKIKEKILPVDYQQNLCKRARNLRQKETSMCEYTKEFFKLSLKSGMKELEYQRVERYINGIKY